MSAPFERGLDQYLAAFQAAARKGLARAGMLCLRDAVMDAPMVPLDEGTLKGSGSVFVGNDLVGTSEQFASGNPQAKPTPATEYAEQLAADQLKATVGFNTPYAARLHEGVEFEFQHSGHGAKYLESKLAEKGDFYMQEIADTIDSEMAKAGFKP